LKFVLNPQSKTVTIVFAMKPATTIVKVCQVLDTFRDRPVLGVMEIAERTGLLPSDAHRIVASLQAFGYIERDAETRKYSLGLELLRLGHRVLLRLEIRDVGRPFLRGLAEAGQGTANLAIMDAREQEIVFIEQIDSPAEALIKPRIGARASPHVTAVGKVLCAHLPVDEVRRLLQKEGLPRKTRHTITEPAKLDQEFENVRANGYAVDREEALEGSCCLGAPVRNHTGAVVAAISLSMRTPNFNRWQEAKLASLVKTSAARFSAALGYREVKVRKARAT
jgi:DNA-binding IclR family transcriptional regulator